MSTRDRIEFWEGEHLMFGMDSSFAPAEGELVNIKKRTYRVIGRSFTVDHADDFAERQIRCNVILEFVSDSHGSPN